MVAGREDRGETEAGMVERGVGPLGAAKSRRVSNDSRLAGDSSGSVVTEGWVRAGRVRSMAGDVVVGDMLVSDKVGEP